MSEPEKRISTKVLTATHCTIERLLHTPLKYEFKFNAPIVKLGFNRRGYDKFITRMMTDII